MSCPQACIFPSVFDENVKPVSSKIGKASMSALIPNTRPSVSPSKTPITPVPPSHISNLISVSFNVLYIKLVVLNSRSEEHTSELQSRFDLVCRLLLEKKNIIFQLYEQFN